MNHLWRPILTGATTGVMLYILVNGPSIFTNYLSVFWLVVQACVIIWLSRKCEELEEEEEDW